MLKGKNAKAREWVSVSRETPQRTGTALPDIPVVFHGPKGTGTKVEKLPLSDLIALNLNHYRMDADYKHGLHFTAPPTAWVAGFPVDTQLSTGSMTAWVAWGPHAAAQTPALDGADRSAIR